MTNGDLNDFKGNDKVYTADIKARDEGVVTIKINKGALSDAAGTKNVNAVQFQFTQSNHKKDSRLLLSQPNLGRLSNKRK